MSRFAFELQLESLKKMVGKRLTRIEGVIDCEVEGERLDSVMGKRIAHVTGHYDSRCVTVHFEDGSQVNFMSDESEIPIVEPIRESSDLQ